MTYLHIHLLGRFQVFENGQPVSPSIWARVQALLAYLLLHRESPTSRQHLAFLLWPDSSEVQARTNLRVLLHRLRRDFPTIDGFINLDRTSVGWRNDATYTLDVAIFEAALARAEAVAGTAALAHLEEAAAGYGGDLLPDHYDDWILAERERLHNRYLSALTQLTYLLETERRYAEAIEYAQRLLAADPLREASHRRLMQLHAADNDRAAALQDYHACAALLERELGMEPSAETRKIYERLSRQEEGPREGFHHIQTATIPLVGRQAEWQQMQRVWQQATTGKTQMVLIWGEAGMGKTRLAEEVVEFVRRQGYATAATRSYQAEGALAYAPIGEWLRTPALMAAIESLDDLWRVEVARLLPELLKQRFDLPSPGPLRESWQRQRFYQALVQAMGAIGRPLLLHIDDLQWTDAETLAWIHFLLRSRGIRLLVLATARIEEVTDDHPLRALLHPLRQEGKILEIELGPLSAAETAFLAEQTAGEALSPAVQMHLWRQSEGHPLFLVEMVRTKEHWLSDIDKLPGVSESVSPSANSKFPVPQKVHAVIVARLSQLSPAARDMAELAAVIGRSFSYSVLHDSSSTDEAEFALALDELWRRRILSEQGDGYDFSHDRIREVTYRTIGAARRRLLHRNVAATLEQSYVNELDSVCGLLAAHYEQAYDLDRSLKYHLLAGQAAMSLYANDVAILHFQRGLALLQGASTNQQRLRQELDFQGGLVSVLGYSRGRVPLLETSLLRVRDLCDQLGETEQLNRILVQLSWYYRGRAEFQKALEIDEGLLVIGETSQDPVLLLDACYSAGGDLFYLGDFERSRTVFERGAQINERRNEILVDAWRESYGASLWAYYARLLWALGFPDLALEKMLRALALCRELNYPPRLAFSLFGAARLRKHRQEVDQTKQLAEELINYAERVGFPQRVAHGKHLLGWSLTHLDRMQEGIELMREGLAEWTAAGTEKHRPDMMAAIAEAHARNGEPERGLALLLDAQRLIEQRNERLFEAEVYRLKGTLLMEAAPHKTTEAEHALVHALKVARRQQAKSLELRAATNLAALWRRQGQMAQARALLTPIYAWFSEGFDTRDLRDARQLLDTLQLT